MLKLFAFFGRVFFAMFEGVFYAFGYMAGSVSQSGRAKPVKAVRQAQVQKPVGSERTIAPAIHAEAKGTDSNLSIPAAQARPVQTDAFQVADRVQTAELYGKGGIQLGMMWLYLYPEKRIAKRVFKVTHRPLAIALKWDRRYMPDVPFDKQIGFQPIMDAMAREVSALLNKTQEPKREKLRDKPQTQPKATAAASNQVETRPKAPAETVKPVSNTVSASQEARSPVAQQPVQKPDSDDTSVVMPNSHRAVKGETYIGKVTTAGMTQKDGADGPYQTFCLTIHDGEREIPLSGNELKRQVRDLGVKVGENVKVVFMGKVAVDVPGKKKPGFKNLYQVTRVEERA